MKTRREGAPTTIRAPFEKGGGERERAGDLRWFNQGTCSICYRCKSPRALRRDPLLQRG
jgi:hypothetical protein